jgi:hypothetical protein
MAYQKLLGQATRILRVIPSDSSDIPFPGDRYYQGKTTAVNAPNVATTAYDLGASLSIATLEDSNADFKALGVEQGDVVYNNGAVADDIGAGRVIEVLSGTKLSVLTSELALVGAGYMIQYANNIIPYSLYRQPKEPCMIYPIINDKNMQAVYISAGGDVIDTVVGTGPGALLDSPIFPSQVRRINRKDCYIAGSGVGTTWALAVW